MNVIGIIAEYNPFHQGHAYQIEKLKKDCLADYVIIAMSGNFVQRGTPALLEKYTRAEMALSCGADLVLELPTLFATASAEYFAKGGVSLLHSTGIVTHLGFGAETADIKLLKELAAVLSEQPKPFQEILRKELKAGASFPAARARALETYLSIYKKETDDTGKLGKILSSPNNILALEYLKALQSLSSGIIPVPILRQGRGYHDTTIAEDFCSASAIRARLKEDDGLSLPKTAMPRNAYTVLENYPHPLLFEDDFSTLLHYELLSEDTDALADWGDSSPELARRLRNEREQFKNWSSFCLHMKTRNVTYTRLSRLFLHMLLHIRQEDYTHFPFPSYLRVLGFRKEAAPLLTAMKAHSSLPILTSVSSAHILLTEKAQQLLSLDLRAADLYRLVLTSKGDSSLKNDYHQQILRL